MRILVTGGAGFIGCHLCARLLQAGHRVEVLDDLSSGRAQTLAGLEAGERLNLRQASAADPEAVKAGLEGADAVVHLAASVGVGTVHAEPVHSIVNGSRCTETVLEAASRSGVPVLLASSSEVYGRSDRVPFREDADLHLGPTTCTRWSYACNKALGEWLALAHHTEHGLPVTIVRLFNTVGPGQRGESGMVLPRFASQALQGQPLTVHGDGSQTRCFAHVRDVALILEKLLERGRHQGEIFNVGGTHELSILSLAQQVRDSAGSDSPVTLIPYAEAYGPDFQDLPRRVPSLDRIQQALGLVPQTSLDEILRDVLADQRARLAAL